jgi:DNA-3-methyladenine glycosylase II
MSPISTPQKNAPPKYRLFLAKDRRLAKILAGQENFTFKKRKDLPSFLYWSIINQQLSVKVGAVFYRRFLDLFGGKVPASATLATIPTSQLRTIGLSNAKSQYIQNVAQFDLDHGLNHKTLGKLSDADLLDLIRSIKGVGPWTASVFLMNAVGREDVFPIDDLILQKAIATVYDLDPEDKKVFLVAVKDISEKWSPYRSYASMHLWLWAHNRSKPNPMAESRAEKKIRG